MKLGWWRRRRRRWRMVESVLREHLDTSPRDTGPAGEPESLEKQRRKLRAWAGRKEDNA